ncbi:uncharacterized protein LOC134739721 isoform X2 [Pongo pygmaeus]|uniref:uncharacterized protein LOC134739721 isoform X2 n=1 Tax=Pongo pygmaeus TaxID=9600 RepID=UPI00300C3170
MGLPFPDLQGFGGAAWRFSFRGCCGPRGRHSSVLSLVLILTTHPALLKTAGLDAQSAVRTLSPGTGVWCASDCAALSSVFLTRANVCIEQQNCLKKRSSWATFPVSLPRNLSPAPGRLVPGQQLTEVATPCSSKCSFPHLASGTPVFLSLPALLAAPSRSPLQVHLSPWMASPGTASIRLFYIYTPFFGVLGPACGFKY